eukprot:6351046-Alexandrium_andersonii.AAC.1
MGISASCGFLRLPGALPPPGPPLLPGGATAPPPDPPKARLRRAHAPFGGVRGGGSPRGAAGGPCLLYTSDAADDM